MNNVESMLLNAGYGIAIAALGVLLMVTLMMFGPGPRRDAADCSLRAGHVFIVDTRECLALPRNAFVPAR